MDLKQVGFLKGLPRPAAQCQVGRASIATEIDSSGRTGFWEVCVSVCVSMCVWLSGLCA